MPADGEIGQKFQAQHLKAKELFIFYVMGATQQPTISKPDAHVQLIFVHHPGTELTVSKRRISDSYAGFPLG